MKRVLLLFTTAFPYGEGEGFVANEIEYLSAEVDELVIISNAAFADDDHRRELPSGVTCLALTDTLSLPERLKAAFTALAPEPRAELRRIRAAYSLRVTRRVRNTVLVSWFRARKFSRLLRTLAAQRPGARIYAYSYWANDMALAVAMARSRGWVHRAVCRAHGWDVYFERSAAGFLPFRRYLAENLDAYRFVSEDGLAYFRARENRDYPSLGHARLGTEQLAPEPLAQRDPFVLISCSSMIPLKAVERIAQALEGVRRGMTWIHIGDGPSRSMVEAVIARLPGSIQVELTGQLSHAEVLATYRMRRPSVFISLSHSEGIPVSMMEAMSAGVPVIGTAVGGVPEMVDHRRNGMLLDPGPPLALVRAAIEEFAEMPEAEYRAYARAAWSTWDLEFNAAVNYPRFIEDALGE